MRLADRQRRFLDALYAEHEPQGALAIHRRNLLANLHGALAQAYPVVERLVGGAFFREAAERYTRLHPSRSGDLHRYGDAFADFLATYPHARELPYIADVARLEWLCAESFHAADSGRFDFAALGALPERERVCVRLALQPAFRRMRSAYPIVAIWEANQSGRDGTPARATGADNAVVYREGFEVRVESVDDISWRFLSAVAMGTRLEAIAEDGQLAPRLADELVRWTRCGAIDGFAR